MRPGRSIQSGAKCQLENASCQLISNTMNRIGTTIREFNIVRSKSTRRITAPRSYNSSLLGVFRSWMTWRHSGSRKKAGNKRFHMSTYDTYTWFSIDILRRLPQCWYLMKARIQCLCFHCVYALLPIGTRVKANECIINLHFFMFVRILVCFSLARELLLTCRHRYVNNERVIFHVLPCF